MKNVKDAHEQYIHAYVTAPEEKCLEHSIDQVVSFFHYLVSHDQNSKANLLLITLSPSQAIANYTVTLSSYCQLHCHALKLLRIILSPSQAIANYTVTLSSYCELYCHPLKLLPITLSRSQAIANYTVTLSSYCELYCHPLKLL